MLKILIDRTLKYHFRHFFDNKSAFTSKKPPWKILFFGSDDFSLYSLKALFEEQTKGTVINKLGVVTNSENSTIWKFADKHNLQIYKWPVKLEENTYDLGLVVSFGYLIPETIINKFPLGMLNVHASLLPRWRGAAPIIYALANGDKTSGVSIMRIKPKHFDVGEILHQEKVFISQETIMPDLYKKLAILGAECLVETLKNLEQRFSSSREQPEKGITYAPKITPQFARIKWHSYTSTDIYNLNRALKTIMELTTSWKTIPVKLIDIEILDSQKDSKFPGFVEYDRKSRTLIVECANKTWIRVNKVGVLGKKVMSATDFNNGYLKKESNKINCFIYNVV